MSAVLAEMTPGFRDPVHGAQQSFRTLLDAMSRPGRVQALPSAALDGIVPPSVPRGTALSLSTAAVLLCLLDAETTVHLSGRLATAPSLAWLRFHTGVRLAARGDAAAFTVTRAAELETVLWEALDIGSDEAPQDGGTLIVEVDSLETGTPLQLRGPGIEGVQPLCVAGPSPAFWQWRRQLSTQRPRGIDLVLCCGDRLTALPRSTRIEIDPEA